MLPPGNEVCGRRARAGPWPQLGDLSAVASDHQRLAARDTVEDLSPVVAQISYGNGLHDQDCITGETHLVVST